jgi:hypothetical protein
MSTLIHFVPLLTTTAPCGQYFFFNRAPKNFPAAQLSGGSSSPLLDLIDFAAKPHILWHRPTERPIHLSLDA